MPSPVAIRDGSFLVTVLLLVAGVLLVTVGAAGVGASLALVAALLALAAGVFLARPDRTFGRVLGIDIDQLLRWLPLGVALATVPLLVRLSATPGEVQAFGGLVGLAGMANYFLRPLYLLCYDLGRKLAAYGRTA